MEKAVKVEQDYKEWLANIYKKKDGSALQDSSIKGTAQALKNRVSKLEGIEITPTNLFYHDKYEEMLELQYVIKSADNYAEENHKAGRGYLSQGLLRYIEFLAYRDGISVTRQKQAKKKIKLSKQEIIDQRNSEYDDFIAENRVKNRLVKRKNAKYIGKPRTIEIDTDKSMGNEKRYIRHKERAENALAIANYKCEVDGSHITFKRRRDPEINYTESHHLIPMGKQKFFEYTLDTEENIVSLCSHCHNCIHYGTEASTIITKLYYARKELLKKAGIGIELEDLLKMYGDD